MSKDNHIEFKEDKLRESSILINNSNWKEQLNEIIILKSTYKSIRIEETEKEFIVHLEFIT